MHDNNVSTPGKKKKTYIYEEEENCQMHKNNVFTAVLLAGCAMQAHRPVPSVPHPHRQPQSLPTCKAPGLASAAPLCCCHPPAAQATAHAALTGAEMGRK